MTDKEKIKQEIERRMDLYSIAEKDDSTFARMGELSSLMDFIDSMPEESASANLDEAAKEFGIRQGVELKPFAIKFFKAGAELQKQKDQESIKLVKEPDLDKAAKEHTTNLYGEDWMKNEHVQDNGFKAISNFKFGAGWQKQQMMKDAVYGYVSLCHDYPRRRSLVAIEDGLTDLKYAQKIKIIICKTEQQ